MISLPAEEIPTILPGSKLYSTLKERLVLGHLADIVKDRPNSATFPVRDSNIICNVL